MNLAEEAIAGFEIDRLCELEVTGSGPVANLIITSRDIQNPESESRRLTPDRMRIGEHLLKASPVREMLIAHKTICEWLEQDQSKTLPPARLEARDILEMKIREAGEIPGAPGQRGAWMTSTKPTSEAGNAMDTIRQALRAFAFMVGTRNVYVIGKEKG